VPGGDVGDDAERLGGNGLRQFRFPIAQHRFVAQGAGRFPKKEIESRQQAGEFVARLSDRLSDFARQKPGEFFAVGFDGGAKFSDGLKPASQGSDAQAGCAVRAASNFARMLAESSTGIVATVFPVAGLVRVSMASAGALTSPRKKGARSP